MLVSFTVLTNSAPGSAACFSSTVAAGHISVAIAIELAEMRQGRICVPEGRRGDEYLPSVITLAPAQFAALHLREATFRGRHVAARAYEELAQARLGITRNAARTAA